MKTIISLFIALSCFVALGAGYASGPGSCITTGGSMSSPADENGGFTLTGVPATYEPGDTYTITLSGGNNFKGVLLYAQAEDSGYRGGSWTTAGTTQHLSCSGETSIWQEDGATLGHTSQLSSNPVNSIELEWTAPDPGVGPLIFKGIVVVTAQDVYTLDTVTSDGDGTPPPKPEDDAATGLTVSVVSLLAALLSLLVL